MNVLRCVCVQYDFELADLESEHSLLCAVPFCKTFIVVVCIGIVHVCRGILFTENARTHFGGMHKTSCVHVRSCCKHLNN
jgi:hypothetical protein